MSNYKTVFFTLGILQIILGVFMFVPIIIQFVYSEVDSSFFGASIVTIIFGTLFFLSNLDHDKKLTLQQAFLLTALSWFSIAIFGSLPFILSNLKLIIVVPWYSKDLFNRALGDSFDQVHTIYIETLTACNLRCSYCPNSVYERGLMKNNEEMDTELFYKIIDE